MRVNGWQTLLILHLSFLLSSLNSPRTPSMPNQLQILKVAVYPMTLSLLTSGIPSLPVYTINDFISQNSNLFCEAFSLKSSSLLEPLSLSHVCIITYKKNHLPALICSMSTLFLKLFLVIAYIDSSNWRAHKNTQIRVLTPSQVICSIQVVSWLPRGHEDFFLSTTTTHSGHNKWEAL